MNIAAISEPNTITPAHAATQKMRRPRDVEVVERGGRASLAQHERDAGGERDQPEPERERAAVRHRREVDRQHERRDEQHGQDAAEVVDRVGRLVHVRGDQLDRQHQRDQRERHVARKTEPQSKCSSSAPDISGPSAEIAPPMPDHSAIARVRPGPDHSAVISASVVGKARPAATPPSSRAANSTPSDGAKPASRQAGIASAGAEHEHQLAPVAVADRAEVEHRGGEPERVADGDEVQPRLPGVEVLRDVRQRDVRDREVEVGDGRDEDQRGEDERRAGRSASRGPRRGLLASGRHAVSLWVGRDAMQTPGALALEARRNPRWCGVRSRRHTRQAPQTLASSCA